jgi:DNA-binding cell septation regulator SpoVG
MNPKVEVVKLKIQKKGQQVGTFSTRVVIEGGFEVTLPGMRIVEGAKGAFIDVPSRKFKESGFVPFYYLNKPLRDLVTHEGLAAYRQATEEKVPAGSVAAVSSKPAALTGAAGPAKPWVKREWKQNQANK